MDAGDGEVAAAVIDRVHLVGMGEDAGCTVADDGTVLPAAFPELVADLQIFLCEIIAVVMARLLRLADIEGATVQVGGDDVPADAPFGQMIECRDAAGEGVGMVEGKRRRQAETQMFRFMGHRRHQL
ncbi:hypothetical protein D9M70_520050 [compost metagenome]